MSPQSHGLGYFAAAWLGTLAVALSAAAAPADGPVGVARVIRAEPEVQMEITAEEILELLSRNLEAGDEGADAHTYWSPVMESSSGVMEIELPAGVPASAVRISVPHLSHMVASARTDFITKAAASCNNDATCYASTYPELNAVARMVFTSGGSSYLCTGTLLADKDTSTTIPYFLSANHCISSQSVAST